MRFPMNPATALLVALFVASVNCACDRSGEAKPASNDGEVTQFFKNLGCDIKKGAEKVSDSAKPYIEDIKKGAERVSDSAKPYIDDIGSRAKKLGGNVADRFNDLKEKISGNPDNSTVTPTEKSSLSTSESRAVDDRSSSSSSSPSSSSTTSASSTPTTPVGSSSILPEIDDRFILDVDKKKCGENQMDDGRGHCRNIG